MAWQTVIVDPKKTVRGTPAASIGYGRISLNVAACNLIDNYTQYKHVELQEDPERPGLVGIRFLKEATSLSISIKYKMVKNPKTREYQQVGGLEISSKEHMNQLLGGIGTGRKTTKFKVEKEQPDFLVISPWG